MSCNDHQTHWYLYRYYYISYKSLFFFFWLIIPKAKFCFVLFFAFGFFGTLKLCFPIFVLKMYQRQWSRWIWKGCREYRAASDIPEEGKSSKLHTSFHSPCYPSSNFLDIRQLSRDWWPILHPSLMNILLHISDREFRFTNLTVCFINSFPYLLLLKTSFSTKPMNYLLKCHVRSPYVLINEVFSCVWYLPCPAFSTLSSSLTTITKAYCMREAGH